jgi:hypothetical protein
MAGFLPPQGAYVDDTTYFYSGKISGNANIPIGGNIAAGVKADVWANFVTGLWVTPVKLFGGDFAVSATVPFGTPDITAGALISGPLGNSFGASRQQATFNAGDPVLTGTIGWHEGNWHWKVAASASIPAGAYQPGQLSNLALNRWVGDFSGAVTYLDPALGLDLSMAVGYTVNGTNSATDYTTGDEFHVDAAITKYLTRDLTLGAILSHYQQVTGDSGSGAKLGAFMGRTTAIGGMIGYTFHAGELPITTRVKLMREVDVANRPEGTIGWLQVSLPVWVPQQSTPKP